MTSFFDTVLDLQSLKSELHAQDPAAGGVFDGARLLDGTAIDPDEVSDAQGQLGPQFVAYLMAQAAANVPLEDALVCLWAEGVAAGARHQARHG